MAGFDIGALGQQVAGEAIGAGMGMFLGNYNDNRQYNQQKRLQALQIQGQKEMTDYNRMAQLAMWRDTGYGPQMEQMKAAGLNPALLYGGGGGGGQTASISGGNVTGASAPQGGREAIEGAQMGLGMQLQAAQVKVLETQADKNEAEAAKTKGVDTDVAGQQFENLRQAFDNTKLDMTMKNILNFEQQASQEDRLHYIEYQTKSALSQARIIANQKNISDATLNDQITTIKQQAIEATMKNVLLNAQVSNTQADTILKNEQTKKLANDIMIGWGQLSVNERAQKVDELAKTMAANNPSLMNVIGRELNTAISDMYNLLGVNREVMQPGNKELNPK